MEPAGFHGAGISAAFLGGLNPIGTIFSALFISHITTGGNLMNASYFPPEVADFISGIIIYLCAFSLLFKSKVSRLIGRRERREAAIAAAPPAAPPAAEPNGKEGDKE